VNVLIVAPLWFPIAGNAHGGIETLLTALIAALERAGCRTTLIAAGDSQTAARLVNMAAFDIPATPGEDLLFIGRIEPAKGVDLAVQAARTLGRGLVLAGPIIDRQCFDVDVAPFLGKRIHYVGVVDHARKVDLFARAAAVVMPSRIDEACPMVCIEALACGTPVVGSTRGALPELIEPGLTGYLADATVLPERIDAALRLDRMAIRGRAAHRFDINAVAARYLTLYAAFLERDRAAPVAAGTSGAV
jgi:glycosyltransferase involved in cell wall biosynthesis